MEQSICVKFTSRLIQYDGDCSVPVVWDKKTNTIVNNESSEIIRMLNSEFNEFCETPAQKELDLYPEALRSEIDELNSWIYPKINNGVYKSGFATSQEAYDKAVKDVFEGLDRVEEILSKKRYLTGNSITEADIRLLTSLLRFDTVYHGYFKCNKKRIVDYPNMWGYVRDLYGIDGISETVDQEHIQKCYQLSPRSITPRGILAIGPDIDFNAPHNREKLLK
ncbi:Glutathione S-transferase omega-like 2 [Holothuria leucospilota]|uniref:Glutathione S-transferase omega-like 2 n=1 Tax=Holothuria leucospilota TaxID=206669 RepID=A0A9Q1BIL8_HOLLE|nr:Glutathione S-transferase omega-like 2 [Holothuria leucospilota]